MSKFITTGKCMFKNLIFLASIISAALLTGCYTFPGKLPPSPLPSTIQPVISTAFPSAVQKYAYTDIDGTYFGVSGASGSAAVGLLLGPLGVAANVAHINSVNKERAAPLTALTSLDLSKILSQELSSLKSEKNTSANPFRITPAASLLFKSDKAYWLSCTITAEFPQANGSSPWNARYLVPVEGTFDASNAGDTSNAQNALGPCLRRAYKLFEEHVAGKLGIFELRTVSSRTGDGSKSIDLQYLLATSRLPSEMLANDFLGIYELRRSDVIQLK